MKRDEGMLAIFFASRMMGESYENYNIDGDVLLGTLGESIWHEMSWHYPYFSGWDKSVVLGNDQWDNAMIAAYFYNMSRMSKMSDSLIFDYDEKSNSMRLNESLTHEEALRAVVRLYDSGLAETERIKTDQDAELLKAADARRKAILESQTSIVTKGNVYYISNSGNDFNDGRSPETAWATIEKANQMALLDDDTVFLECGGIFRGILLFRNNITYSAYGEGEKPKILGSPENGANPAKWKLMAGTKNIWIFYREIYETGVIVLNDGEKWANRETALWNGEEYVNVVDKKRPIDINQLKDMTFFQDVDYSGYSSEEAIGELNIPGKIYMRCDLGNPGKVFKSIEFESKPYGDANLKSSFILQVGENCLIDNLCFLYCQGGISVSGNCTVQNCEVAWIGGSVAGYNGSGLGTDTQAVLRFGDGILCAKGSNNNVLNNYVHHMYDFGITAETGPWFENEEDRYAYETIFKGNLVENCSGGFLIGDWEALQSGLDHSVIFKNICIGDNTVLFSGYGWSHQELDYDWGHASAVNNGNSAITFAYPPKAAQNIEVKNNIFYVGKYALVSSCYGAKGLKGLYNVKFDGNTYVQNPLGTLAYWQKNETDKIRQCFINNSSAKETISNVLEDKNGVTWK
ncbi:right-handed parallel beta-helix repeat-containing protein [Fusibacter ferrireducens]|uniref:Right-handed parallel beta-helix repeat-containing protein n=1 Tax=Fusibacter ferrireducens TaxID=2785058 RepID=A0ABR9ZQ93_9FIRM|nr:right-handed parallel beta-helix repeat-containing protein [Fusibacter ferrireducens]MBF4691804.1 right-handed parallel beta-helix repeat-containing protein [Fusibacter ferrireducens]